MTPNLKLCSVFVLFLHFTGFAAVHYVNVNSPVRTPPYATWETAANTIQDAVDAASAGDEILVTNGVYATGGRAVYGTMTNRVVIDKAVTVQSVNGPGMTFIVGQGAVSGATSNGFGAIRCVYLGSNAILSGFTLTNGHTQLVENGGGAWCEPSGVLTNCTLVDNSATESSGGAHSGILNNCILSGNSAAGYGGGSCLSTLNNCTLKGNSAFHGGGASGNFLRNCTLNNCTLIGNSAQYGGGAYAESLGACILNNCALIDNSATDSAGAAYYSLLNNCALISNSATAGAGVVGGVLNDCTLSRNIAQQGGGAAHTATLHSCTLASNSAMFGGAVYSSALVNCILTSNRASESGGGAYSSWLTNCTLTANWAYRSGGGVNEGTLKNCTLITNSTSLFGGGVFYANLNNCTLTGNTADYDGGGAYGGTLINCNLNSNSVYRSGGGAYQATLVNCTLAGNSAKSGGGVVYCTLTNCIAYFNMGSTGQNYSESTFAFSCTTPLPPGAGNISNAPLFVNTNGWSDLHLQSSSPCINIGNNAYVQALVDLDGHPRISGGIVDMGAYEYELPPTLDCPGDIAVENDPGTSGAAVYYNAPVGTVTGAISTQVSGLTNGAFFPIGRTTNSFLVIDSAGNSASCSFTVTVSDAEPPQIQCPLNIVQAADAGQCSKSNLNWTVTATDNDMVARFSCEPPSGSTFSVGTHQVTCAATDISGNTKQCQFTVAILDIEAPLLVCPQDMAVEFRSTNGAVVAFETRAIDNCALAGEASCVPPTGSIFPIGTTAVLCNAADLSGNFASARFNVTVIGARGTKGNALAELLAVQSTSTNSSDIERLADAIGYLAKSLDPALWLDENHVVNKGGDKVFNEEKEAAYKLRGMVNDRACTVSKALLESCIDRMVQADWLLAVVEIQEAAKNGGNTKKIAEDLKELAKGDEERNAKDYEQAIDHYRNAWRHAAHLYVKTQATVANSLRHIELLALPGAICEVQTSTNLVDWFTVGIYSAGADGVVAVDYNEGTSAMEFYRVVQTP